MNGMLLTVTIMDLNSRSNRNTQSRKKAPIVAPDTRQRIRRCVGLFAPAEAGWGSEYTFMLLIYCNGVIGIIDGQPCRLMILGILRLLESA